MIYQGCVYGLFQSGKRFLGRFHNQRGYLRLLRRAEDSDAESVSVHGVVAGCETSGEMSIVDAWEIIPGNG